MEQDRNTLFANYEGTLRYGHPAPVYKNDRAWKAFELFIPELDKEVDMVSDLMKTMFGGVQQAKAHDEAQEAQVEAQVAPQVAGEVTDQDTRQAPDKYPTSHPARSLGLEGCRDSFFKVRPSTSLGPPKSGAFYGFGSKTPSHQWSVRDGHPGQTPQQQAEIPDHRKGAAGFGRDKRKGKVMEDCHIDAIHDSQLSLFQEVES